MSGLRKLTNTGLDFYVIYTVQLLRFIHELKNALNKENNL